MRLAVGFAGTAWKSQPVRFHIYCINIYACTVLLKLSQIVKGGQLGKKTFSKTLKNYVCVFAHTKRVQVCEMRERLGHNNELPEAAMFAQAQVCPVCVWVLLPRWLTCFTPPQ